MTLETLLLAVTGLAAPPDLAPPAPAGLVLTGGKVWTGDPTRPEAEAVAIAGDRIAAVGSSVEARRAAPPGAREIDLRGRRVVPGFIDSHVHFLDGGEELLAPDLRSAPTEEEMARRLGEAAARLPTGAWLTSGAWDHENWPGARLPRRETLDRHTPRNPVLVGRIDGHMGLANSLALRMGGVTAATADPPGGEIVRDAAGEPTGVLKDAALGLVSRHVPPPDAPTRRERALAALRHAAALGVTGVHDMGTSADALETFRALRASGELTARITAYVPLASLDRRGSESTRAEAADAWVRVAGIKAFADGSLGSSTALFFEPYVAGASPGKEHGLAQTDLSKGGQLERSLREASSAGLQPAVHAIGDRAIREVLDIYERIGKLDALRPRIEHAQHIHPSDLARFGALGVIASMQPMHAADDGRWAEGRIGRVRCETTYAFRDLLDRGARLAFGSDWPVATLSPLRGIEAAVTRRTVDGKNPGGWIPRQKIGVEEALRAYTAGAAYAARDEGSLGAVRVGWLADLVVLEDDILAVEPSRLGDVRVDVTISGGRVVFERTR